MKKKLVIGLTYDLKTDCELKPGEPADKYAEFDKEETIAVIENALKEGGNQVVRIGNGKKLLKFLVVKKGEVDIIFNIAEGINTRSREAQVPAILDMLEIPYVGSDPLTQALTLDKLMAKKIIAYHGLPTPEFILVNKMSDLKKFNLSFPVIAKLRYEGTSKGLDKGAKANNFGEMKKRVRWALETYHQPVLVEEFIQGKEFTIGLIGNEKPEVLPAVQIAINGKLDLGEDFYIHSLVESTGVDYICPAKIKSNLKKKISELAGQCYQVLECRDFGRIDIRCDEKDNPYFLECNPLPSLAMVDIWPIVARQNGLTYNQIINKILTYAVTRNNL